MTHHLGLLWEGIMSVLLPVELNSVLNYRYTFSQFMHYGLGYTCFNRGDVKRVVVLYRR